MLDLDRFKQVNDTLGHPAGDELLKQVAQRLQTIVGKRGEIGRLGGDEFQIIMPDVDDRGDLGELAARLIQMVSQPYSLDGSRATIGTSLGIAIAPYDGIDAEELVSSADLALYAAKGGGRGQYRFYSAELKDGARLRRQIEEDLRDALHRDEMHLAFQPIVRADTNHVAGFEALLRWKHPESGPISPDMFIPIAEETSIILDLGEWALRRACESAAQWPGKLRVAVNVSPVQFGSEGLPDVVARALSSSGLDPDRLELEVTESVLLGDETVVHDTFKKLKKMGVRLVLDDFGTGYSSLGYLRRAPFDKIKIDRSFVRGATMDNNNNAAIISAIVSLAEALGMETVAEGVEAMDELALVRERRATHVQGYVYGEATAQAELVERLESGRLEYKPDGPPRYRSERRTMFRRIGVIHEDHRYEAVMRNLSRTGARIEGLLEVPKGTILVLDLGEGQLAVCKVRRSHDHAQGVEFETPLISDGSDGLCTRHRISPYALAAAGMPLAALPPGHYPLFDHGDRPKTLPQFIQVDLSQPGIRAA
ncbi:EAL domain-containing protein [Leptolyngbya sp. 15MV]|nr:EAL domain-containing protein [Leptolyngbya sp. 15MV]